MIKQYMKILFQSGLFLGMLGLIFSCSAGGGENAPKLSKTKMVEVLSDLHILEGGIQNAIKEEKDSLANVYYYHLYKIHDIDEADFHQSLDYFTKRPKEFEDMYRMVCDSIEKKGLELY